MERLHELAANSTDNCSMNICYDTFVAKCANTWREIVKKMFGLEEGPLLDAAVSAAELECPGNLVGGIAAEAHSGDATAPPLKDISDWTKGEMMQMARKLDTEGNSGRVQKLEAKIGCGISPDYE